MTRCCSTSWRWVADVIALIAAVMLFVGAPAQKGGQAEQTAQASKTRTHDRRASAQDSRAERLEHWRSLDAKSRAELTKRFEKLKTLSPEDRAKFLERGKRLQKEIDATLRSLDPKERATLEALDPRERRRVLRGLVGDRARRSAAQLRSQLTKEQRAALETAGPAERAAILRDVHERERSRMSERDSALGRNLGLTEGELRRVERGTKKERRDVMIKVARRRSSRYVKEHGLPSGVTPERWRSIAGSGDDEFLRGYLRIRASHPEFGVSPKQWEQRKERGASMASRLEAFSTPTTAQRASSPRAKEAQLRRAALLGQRARAEELMVRTGHLSRDEAARLRALDDNGFVRMYRQTVMKLRKGVDPRGRPDRAGREGGRERPSRKSQQGRQRGPSQQDRRNGR